MTAEFISRVKVISILAFVLYGLVSSPCGVAEAILKGAEPAPGPKQFGPTQPPGPVPVVPPPS
ncbi:MAG: hypothetical protein BWY14_00839 [Parcubacteria group bacterium ADurb.Bin192]|nr:MAG: hypothetical protein BWY14_00839 [Parcubacteria group bacterium ADurb.Bin192]